MLKLNLNKNKFQGEIGSCKISIDSQHATIVAI